jgi:hypothetical protein
MNYVLNLTHAAELNQDMGDVVAAVAEGLTAAAAANTPELQLHGTSADLQASTFHHGMTHMKHNVV